MGNIYSELKIICILYLCLAVARDNDNGSPCFLGAVAIICLTISVSQHHPVTCNERKMSKLTQF